MLDVSWALHFSEGTRSHASGFEVETLMYAPDGFRKKHQVTAGTAAACDAAAASACCTCPSAACMACWFTRHRRVRPLACCKRWRKGGGDGGTQGLGILSISLRACH